MQWKYKQLPRRNRNNFCPLLHLLLGPTVETSQGQVLARQAQAPGALVSVTPGDWNFILIVTAIRSYIAGCREANQMRRF